MTVLELLKSAQDLKYSPPNGKEDITQYTEDEVYNATVSQILQNPTIVYGMIMYCKKYPPFKIVFKQSLRTYIEKYKS
jgi:hypothetical protein